MPNLRKVYKLGCDPEFIYTKDGRTYDAEDVLGNSSVCDSCPKRDCNYWDEWDCSRYRRAAGRDIKGVGTDCSWGELRPDPGLDPHEAVANLKKLVLAMKRHKTYKDFDYITGGGEEHSDSLGGHIHISWRHPTRTSLTTVGLTDENRGKLVRLLDIFVGIPLQQAKGGRRDSHGDGYGQVGAHRTRRYDGAIGIEYRVPPSFLKNPQLYKAVMETVAGVINKFNRLKGFFRKKIESFNYDAYYDAYDGGCPPPPHRHCYDSCRKCKEDYNELLRSREEQEKSPLPTYEDYKKIGVPRNSARLMANLPNEDIGGIIDVDAWRKYRKPRTKK